MARRIILVTVVLAVAVGGGVALYLHRPAGEALPPEYAGPARHQKYQCAMHPQIVSDKPGTCPICGMKLQPVEDEAAAAPTGGGRTIAFYRHPMRPEVTSPVPAKDEMGMDYVPVYTDELQGGQAGAVPGHAPFTLSPARQQLIGVRAIA